MVARSFALCAVLACTLADTNTFSGLSTADTWFTSAAGWSAKSFPSYPDTAAISTTVVIEVDADAAARVLDVSEGSTLTIDEATLDLGPTICFPQTQIRLAKATASADTRCEDSKTICTSEQWEVSPTTATAHRVCSAITHCAPGYYETAAPTATSDRTCGKCAKGEFKAGTGQTPCLACAVGSYNDQTGQASCTSCDAPENDANYNCKPGWTHINCAAESGGSCVKCEAGKEKARTGPEPCGNCAAGSYTDIAGEATCLACAEGRYQTLAGATKCTACATGTYGVSEGAVAQAECSHCPAGKFQDDTGATDCKACEKGAFGDVSTATVAHAAHCVSCPAGKFQEADGIDKCDECVSGKFMSKAGAHVCEDCHAIDGLRFWWTDGKAGQTKCEPKPLHCEGNTWNNWSGCSKTCGTGERHRTRGYKNQQPCSLLNAEDCSREWPIGKAHACDTVKTFEEEPCNIDPCPIDCDVGAWSDWSTCTQACHKPGQDVGSHYRTRTLVQPKYSGHGCPHSREVAPCHTSCCKGYEQDEPGSSTAADDMVTQAATRISNNTQVESIRSRAGHYQIKFSDAAAVCAARGSGWAVCSHEQVEQAYTAGMNVCACGWASDAKMYYPLQKASKFCGAQTGVHDCGSLTYKGAFGDAFCCGQRKQPTCTECTPGTYSSWLGLGKCVACPVGKYQTAFGKDSCTSCAKGTASTVVGATAASSCVECHHGTYADDEGSSTCKSCGAGTAQGSTGATHGNFCIKCVAGTYAANAATRTCKACESGRFQASEGKLACTNCAAGTFVAETGSTNEIACLTCGVGTYAVAGSAKCTECDAGTASAATGAPSVITCAPCAEGSSSGSGASTCTQCAVGRYQSAVGSAVCNACTAGTYNPKTASTSSAACLTCPLGHFCPEGVAGPSKCGAGMHLNSQGAKAQSECATCALGRFHTDEGVAECIVCPIGTYQDIVGQTGCKDCAAGRAQPFTERKAISDCEACHAGKYQPVPKRSFCVECGKGFYETATGALGCTKCAAGQFGDVHGADTAAKGCTDCVAGRYSTTTGSTGCQSCEIGKFSTSVAASVAATCEHCDWGTYTNVPGSTACLKCSKGHYGETQGTQKGKITHCLQCAVGKYQQYDGSTKCEECEAGKFVNSKGNHECTGCGKVDDVRINWSASGATECYKKKVDCKVSQWSSWSTCSLSCKAGTSAPGSQHRARQPVDQLPCALTTGCHEGWGVGAKLCAEWDQHEVQDCNVHQCPVNCEISQWAGWSQCTKSCGEGETKRTRSITKPLEFGGSCDHHFSETTECNRHSCDIKLLPKCHGEHIHCKVVQKQMPNWAKDTDGWGKSDTTNQCHRWWVYAYGNCHHCDTPEECALKGLHETIVVTHDKKFAHLKEQRNMFHCFYAHEKHPEKARNILSLAPANSCFCTCRMHPPCAGQKGKELSNTAIVGNHWHNIETQQTCCNMCTNHPDCESFTYKQASKECTFFMGSPVYKNAPAAVAATTWSGCQSGDVC
jgi:hypothetical protein